MAIDFQITSENNPDIFRDVTFKGSAKTYSFDLSQWAEENNTISTATWTVEAGQASISGETLSSDVATALVTFSQSGGALIKIVFAGASEIYVAWLDVIVKDLKAYQAGNDYCIGRY